MECLYSSSFVYLVKPLSFLISSHWRATDVNSVLCIYNCHVNFHVEKLADQFSWMSVYLLKQNIVYSV